MTNNAITKRTKKAVKGYRGDIDLHRWEVKRKFWNTKDLNTMIASGKLRSKSNLVIMPYVETSIK